ncbi:hypothetical protein BpHYR1_037707 [Brachionus plicatilis]
MKLCL